MSEFCCKYFVSRTPVASFNFLLVACLNKVPRSPNFTDFRGLLLMILISSPDNLSTFLLSTPFCRFRLLSWCSYELVVCSSSSSSSSSPSEKDDEPDAAEDFCPASTRFHLQREDLFSRLPSARTNERFCFQPP